MDNYQRLFNELRPFREKEMQLPSSDELKATVASEWMKYLLNGLNAYEGKSYEVAISFLNIAIEKAPENQHLFKVRANIKEDAGDSIGAISDYKNALYISGNDWYATYNQIAVNYLHLNEYSNSLTAFDIAIELKSKLQLEGIDENELPNIVDGVVERVNYERMFANRAIVKLSLQDIEGCSEDCKLAIEINPEYSHSYYVTGLLFLAVGQNENAYEALKEAESKGHSLAKNVISMYFK